MRALELHDLGDGVGLVVLGVRLLHRRRHQVVVAARDEQQRGPVGVLVVDVRALVAGLEAGEGALPEDAPGRRDVVALVQLAPALLAEGVGERVLPLLGRQADGLVPVGRVLQHRPRRLHLRQGDDLHALGRGGIDRHADGSEAVVEEDLGEHAAGRMPDQDRGLTDPLHDLLEVVDDRGDREGLYGRGVGVERLHLDLEPGVGGRQHPVAPALVVLDPLLPAAGRHPEAVDQDDGALRGRVGAHSSPPCRSGWRPEHGAAGAPGQGRAAAGVRTPWSARATRARRGPAPPPGEVLRVDVVAGGGGDHLGHRVPFLGWVPHWGQRPTRSTRLAPW